MKKPLLLIIFFVIIIISLIISKVGASNKLSTTGIELESLQAQIDKYNKENMILEEKVLEAKSLINLSQKAKSLGFVATKSPIYLSNPLPLAFGHSQ